MFIVNTSLSFGVLNSKEVKTTVKINQQQQVYCENAGNVSVI
jgi:hypothetical protein